MSELPRPEATRTQRRAGRPPKTLLPERSALARLGAQLRAAREAHNLTQTQLAQLIGYCPQHIGAIERADATPSTSLIAACDQALGTDGALADQLPDVIQEQAARRHANSASRRTHPR
jgi:transcriptional regulator with XRE-family HTH domain